MRWTSKRIGFDGHDGPGMLQLLKTESGCGLARLSREGGSRAFGGDVRKTWSSNTSFGRRRQTPCFRLLVAEAESVSGHILEIGNTNGRYSSPGARRFVEEWNAEGPPTTVRLV